MTDCTTCPFVERQLAEIDTAQAAAKHLQRAASIRRLREDEASIVFDQVGAAADLQITAAISDIEIAQASCSRPAVTEAATPGYIAVQCTSRALLARTALSIRPAED